LSWM